MAAKEAEEEFKAWRREHRKKKMKKECASGCYVCEYSSRGPFYHDEDYQGIATLHSQGTEVPQAENVYPTQALRALRIAAQGEDEAIPKPLPRKAPKEHLVR